MSNFEVVLSETDDNTQDNTPDILVNQPAAFGLGLCDTGSILTPEKQAKLTADLEQLTRERSLAQTALCSTHS